jgi:hypothetical protein
MRGVRIYILILVYGAFVGVAAALYFGKLNVPPEWNPWGVIDLESEIGPFTRRQLRNLQESPEQCLSALSVTHMRYRIQPDIPVVDGCGITNGVRVFRSGWVYNRPFPATCGLAAALYVFEREVVQPAAMRYFGQRVVRLDQSGTYDCRNVGFRKGGNRSQHARAKAMDIVRFHLADGRTVRVSKANWDSDGPEAAFLKAVHDGACRVFGTTLGPDYNTTHYTHFHVDMRAGGACR